MVIVNLPFPVCETWLPVVGLSGYEVSNQGLLRSIDRCVPHPKSGALRLKGKLIARHLNKHTGYLFVFMSVGGRVAQRTVHSVVADAFLGPFPKGKTYVLHRDGVKTNCDASNLYYGTQKENAADSLRHGVLAIGTRAKGAVLNEEQVKDIRSIARKESSKALAQRYGVCVSTINFVLQGKTWRHVSW